MPKLKKPPERKRIGHADDRKAVAGGVREWRNKKLEGRWTRRMWNLQMRWFIASNLAALGRKRKATL